MNNDIYTLYTRSNFDGIVCAALLKEINLVDNVVFVHPKDIQDNRLNLTSNDISASLPYSDGVYMAFDHHSSEAIRIPNPKDNYIIELASPSSARIIYEYFGGKSKFSDKLNNLMDAVDNADCTNFTEDDILNPKGWVLLNYLMDSRTGLGRFRHFNISNYTLMEKLTDMLSKKSIDEILQDYDVAQRIDLYFAEQEKFKEQIKRCARLENDIVILDLRNEDVIHIGNRYMVYALFPEAKISIHIFNGKQNQNTVFAVGKSILNRNCVLDIGSLLYKFGGGGHINAGTCQVENDKADETLIKLTEVLQKLN